MQSNRVAEAIDAGVRYLLAHRFSDGHWEDFDLPVGRSDAWVTAYVGLALAAAAGHDSRPCASSAAAGAADWLATHRPYAAGWGYNHTTGPDSDSTAYALLLLRVAARPIPPDDENWLCDRWQATGGFATYARPDAWGMAHPDVTPVAFRALSPGARQRLQPRLVDYLLRTRRTDGTWPAYWWRTAHYCTFLNNSLLRDLGLRVGSCPPVVSADEAHGVHSAVDLVFVTANALLDPELSPLAGALVSELLAEQHPNGHWAGAPNLRVMRHDAKDPWSHPCGRLYADTNHLFTTASAVQVLARLAARHP
jgi:hypothetical protein